MPLRDLEPNGAVLGFDLLNVPAIAAGGVWDPDVGVTETIVPGHYTWTSLPGTAANAEGSILSSLAGGEYGQPDPIPGPNGKTVWTFGSANGAFVMNSAGASLRFATQGALMWWAKLADDAAFADRYMLEMWPGDGVHNRLLFYKDTVARKLVFNGSPLGIGDDVTPDREKPNWVFGVGEYVPTDWNHYALFVDWTRPNKKIGPSHYSEKIRFYLNGVLQEGGQLGVYSAPPDPYKEPPGGPVLGSGLYAGATRLCYGGNYVSSPMKGELGGLIIANGLSGLTPARLPKIMRATSPID